MPRDYIWPEMRAKRPLIAQEKEVECEICHKVFVAEKFHRKHLERVHGLYSS